MFLRKCLQTQKFNVRRLFATIDFSKDYYKILGINSSASKPEIRKAYLTLAKKYHPDAPGGNENKFKEVGEAWEILSNETSKSQYDSGRSSGRTGSYDPNWEQRSRQWQGTYDRQNQWKEWYMRQQQQKEKQKTYYYYEQYDPFTGRRTYYYRRGPFEERKGPRPEDDFFNRFDEFIKRNFEQGRGRTYHNPFRDAFEEMMREREEHLKREQKIREEEQPPPGGNITEILQFGLYIFGAIFGLYLVGVVWSAMTSPHPPPPSHPASYRERNPSYYDPRAFERPYSHPPNSRPPDDRTHFRP